MTEAWLQSFNILTFNIRLNIVPGTSALVQISLPLERVGVCPIYIRQDCLSDRSLAPIYKMFTLIYNKGEFNRPDTLVPFLQSNIGEYPLLQVDCITPYKGKEADLIRDVCEYLSKVEPTIMVTYNLTQNASTESNSNGFFVDYLVIQIHVEEQ